MNLLLYFILPAIIYSNFIPNEIRIDYLPGLDFYLKFNHHSGYLDDSTFFWLFESQHIVPHDPVIFWFGGECSSFLAILEENGPFLLNNDGHTLRENKFSWNKFSSVVYIEHFPYGKYNNKSIEEKYASAIRKFFELNPGFAKREIYLAGKSLAALQLPVVANHLTTGDVKLNIKGLLIGNGFFGTQLYIETGLMYAYARGFLDEDEFIEMVDGCCKGILNECDFYKKNNSECEKIVNLLKKPKYEAVTAYDITKQCEDNSWMKHILGQPNPYFSNNNSYGNSKFCYDVHENIYMYLNKLDVQKALILRSSMISEWKPCESLNIESKPNVDIEHEFKKVAGKGIKTLLYYGDEDMINIFMMGQKFAAKLNSRAEDEKTGWKFNGYLAGYQTDYNYMKFITIRGAGHSPIITHPQEVYQMITKFIRDK